MKGKKTTTKQLLDTYKAWICVGENKKKYIAVEFKANLEQAKKIANVVFKVGKSKLKVVKGYKLGNYIYKSFPTKNRTIYLVWIVEVSR